LSYTGTTTETDTRVTTRSKPDRIPDARFFERFHYCQRADRQLGMLQADPDPAAQSAAWRNAARSSWIDTRLLISYCANHASSKTLDIHARRLSVRALAAAGPRPTPHGAGTGLAADALAADPGRLHGRRLRPVRCSVAIQGRSGPLVDRGGRRAHRHQRNDHSSNREGSDRQRTGHAAR